MTWRGRPLTSHEVVVTIASTRTRSGLRVEAELDPDRYPLGIAISKAQLQNLPVEHHDTHGAWNYTIHPDHPHDDEPVQVSDRDAARRLVLDLLAEPTLTGMSREELAAIAGKTVSLSFDPCLRSGYTASAVGPAATRPETTNASSLPPRTACC